MFWVGFSAGFLVCCLVVGIVAAFVLNSDRGA